MLVVSFISIDQIVYNSVMSLYPTVAKRSRVSTMEVIQEETMMTLPSKTLHRSRGFGLDFGGSLIKITYTKSEGDNVTFYNQTFLSENKDEAFKFLEELVVDIPQDQQIVTCGIGANEFSEQLAEICGNRKLTNYAEGDAMIEGLLLMLRRQGIDDLVHPDDQDLDKYMDKVAKSTAVIQRMFSQGRLIPGPWVSKILDEEKGSGDTARPERTVQFPFLLYYIGSSGQAMRVHEDGGFEFIDLNPVSGRTIVAMGSMFAGAHTFDKVMELAEGGDDKNVNIHMTAMAMNDSDPNYETLKYLDRTAFTFGKGVRKKLDDFDKKDLVRSGIKIVVHGIGQNAHQWATNLKIKQVYFVGGAVRSALFRNLVATEMFYRNKTGFTGHQVDFMFVKPCAHLGSTGCLFRSLDIKLDTVEGE